jgi:hypothetical protein
MCIRAHRKKDVEQHHLRALSWDETEVLADMDEVSGA